MKQATPNSEANLARHGRAHTELQRPTQKDATSWKLWKGERYREHGTVKHPLADSATPGPSLSKVTQVKHPEEGSVTPGPSLKNLKGETPLSGLSDSWS
ncbi:hypothetical protein L2E82_29908 [Cichorium intybus]|uniref:Uncharacterized protein n=1 Tax=Cichorium intybus TaxID=13427 RepID=A0ACB9CZ12_CICIN|nr:hypothetical protein L2E82_29908 [Cichorium intybus]